MLSALLMSKGIMTWVRKPRGDDVTQHVCGWPVISRIALDAERDGWLTLNWLIRNLFLKPGSTPVGRTS